MPVKTGIQVRFGFKSKYACFPALAEKTVLKASSVDKSRIPRPQWISRRYREPIQGSIYFYSILKPQGGGGYHTDTNDPLSPFNLAGKKLRDVIAIDLFDQRVVEKAPRVELGGFGHGGLFEHRAYRFGIDGQIFVPYFAAFLITLLQQFCIGDFGVKRFDLLGGGRVVEG